MTRATSMGHEFVDAIPAQLAEGVLYVCILYATAVHRCACGCGQEVVTPITPTDWQLTFDGETVSLYPSIGSWNLPCQSHYFIRRDTVQWARRWTREEIAADRAAEERAKDGYFNAKPAKSGKRVQTLWSKVKGQFSQK